MLSTSVKPEEYPHGYQKLLQHYAKLLLLLPSYKQICINIH